MITHLTGAQMAVKVGISERSIQRWIQEGRLAAKRLEDSALYEVDTSDLERLRLKGHREEETRIQALERQAREQAEQLAHLKGHFDGVLTIVEERIEAMQATLREVEVQLKALEARLDTLTTASATRAATRHQRREQAEQTTASELPDGLVSAVSFAKLHNIPETTVRKAIQSGRLPTVKGKWKVGRAVVTQALDQAGRERFHDLWPNA